MILIELKQVYTCQAFIEGRQSFLTLKTKNPSNVMATNDGFYYEFERIKTTNFLLMRNYQTMYRLFMIHHKFDKINTI
jgi:hypothetical protein